MIISNNGIHVFVFCCAEYEHFLDECIDSIKLNVLDTVLSLNIVTNTSITRTGCNTIKDPDFWARIDPDFKFKNLYNHNWIKQQIFKLAVDEYVNGNALIVDAEVLFVNKTQWIVDGRVDMYTEDIMPQLDRDTRNMLRDVVDLERQLDASFVTESMIFVTDVLKEIKTQIEQKHRQPWLEVFADLLLVGIERNPLYIMSEYDIYGNYFYKNYRPLVNQIKQKRFDNYISRPRANATSNTGGKTKWLTFYQQIRGQEWPDCDNEEDFKNLPYHIQQECINEFGYNPELHGNK